MLTGVEVQRFWQLERALVVWRYCNPHCCCLKMPENAALCRSSSTLNSDYILSMKRANYSSFSDVRLPFLFTLGMFLLLTHVGASAQRLSDLPAAEEPVSTTAATTRLLSISPDGSRIASLAAQNQLQILDVAGRMAPLLLEPAPCKTFDEHSPHFSLHNKWIAKLCMGGESMIYVIWDLATGRRVGNIPCRYSGYYAAWSHDDTRFAAQCAEDTEADAFVVWEPASAREVMRFQLGRKSLIDGIAFDASGNLLITTMDDTDTHHTFDLFDPALHHIASQKPRGDMHWLTPSSNGKQVAGFTSSHGFFLSHPGKAYIWDTDKREFICLATFKFLETNLWAISDDGAFLLLDLSGGIWWVGGERIAPIAVFSVKEKRYIKTLRGDLKSAVLTSDGRIIALTTRNSEFKIWECCH